MRLTFRRKIRFCDNRRMLVQKKALMFRQEHFHSGCESLNQILWTYSTNQMFQSEHSDCEMKVRVKREISARLLAAKRRKPWGIVKANRASPEGAEEMRAGPNKKFNRRELLTEIASKTPIRCSNRNIETMCEKRKLRRCSLIGS